MTISAIKTAAADSCWTQASAEALEKLTVITSAGPLNE